MLVGPAGAPSHAGARDVAVVWRGEPGISGVTPRSQYHRPRAVADRVAAAVLAAIERGVSDIHQLRRVAAAAAAAAQPR